jgi:hypothetical protein
VLCVSPGALQTPRFIRPRRRSGSVIRNELFRLRAPFQSFRTRAFYSKESAKKSGVGQPIPPLLSEIQVATTNAGARTERRLDPRLFGALRMNCWQQEFHSSRLVIVILTECEPARFSGCSQIMWAHSHLIWA